MFFVSVRDEVRSGESFMSLGLWITIILFAVLALLWGVVGIVFALINTVIVPYETITGPLGLYLWSSLAGKIQIPHVFQSVRTVQNFSLMYIHQHVIVRRSVLHDDILRRAIERTDERRIFIYRLGTVSRMDWRLGFAKIAALFFLVSTTHFG